MRSASAPVIVGLLLGCTPTASTEPPDQGGAAPPAEADANAGEPAAEPTGGDASADVAASDGGASDPGASHSGASDGGASDAGTGPGTALEPAAAGTGTSTLTASSDPGGLTTASDGGEAPADPGGGAKDPEPEPKPVAKLELPKPLHAKGDDSCGNDPGVGERLKSFSLPGIEGDENVTQGSFRGRVLVVNFWGTWCKPCLKELPEFDQLYRRYRKHGMTLLAIATDEDAKTVKDMVTERKLGAKIAIAGEAYAEQYGSSKFPFTFVVDHTGVIKASYRGYKPECLGQLEADIREQLTTRAEAKAKRKK
jgi:peroxiredoxin